jgi:biopolymer transport protein ExbD
VIRNGKNGTLAVGGLRTKFHPRTRIGQGFVSVGPWIDVILLLGFFCLANSQLVLQPGVTVRMPETAYRQGAASQLIAVLLSVPGSESGARREDIVFFDDERFVLASAEQKRQLEQALAARHQEHPESDLVVHCDERVSHGSVVRIMDLAMDVGIRNVHMATRPEE